MEEYREAGIQDVLLKLFGPAPSAAANMKEGAMGKYVKVSGPEETIDADQEVKSVGISYTRMRQYTTGATRDSNVDKLDFKGFDSPLVTKRYAQYMHAHRKQADGSMRGSDNWKAGIPKEDYAESLVRHMEDLKLHLDGYPEEAVEQNTEDVLCAILFNTKGLLYEILREKRKATPPQV